MGDYHTCASRMETSFMGNTNRSRLRLKDEIDWTRRETISIGKRFQQETNRYVGGFHTTTALDIEIFPNGAAEVLSLIALKARLTNDGVVKLSYREVEESVGIKRRRQLTAIQKLMDLGIITRQADNDFFSRRRVFVYHHDRYVQVRNEYVANEKARQVAKEAAEPRTMEDWKRLARERVGSRRTATSASGTDAKWEAAMNAMATLMEQVSNLSGELKEVKARLGNTAPDMYTSEEKATKTEESAQMYKSTSDMYKCTADLYKCTLVNNCISNTEVKEKEEEPIFFEEQKSSFTKKEVVVDEPTPRREPGEAAEIPQLAAHLDKLREKYAPGVSDLYGSELTYSEDTLLKSVRQELSSADLDALVAKKIKARNNAALDRILLAAREHNLESPPISYQAQLEQATNTSLYYTSIDAIVSVILDEGYPTLTFADLAKCHNLYELPSSVLKQNAAKTGPVAQLGAAFHKWMISASSDADYNTCASVGVDLAELVLGGKMSLGDAIVGLKTWSKLRHYSPTYASTVAQDMARIRGVYRFIGNLDVVARSGFFSKWGNVNAHALTKTHTEKITLVNQDNRLSKTSYMTYKGGLPLLVAEFLQAYKDIEIRREDTEFFIDLAFMRIPHFIVADFRHVAFDIWFGENGEAVQVVEEAFKQHRVSTDVNGLAEMKKRGWDI